MRRPVGEGRRGRRAICSQGAKASFEHAVCVDTLGQIPAENLVEMIAVFEHGAGVVDP